MVDFITETINQGGYLGIAFLMLFENIFPPIPSELIMPFAGFAASRGDLSVVGVIIAGTVGSVLGTLIFYYLALIFGEERLRYLSDKFGRWLTLTQKDIDKSQAWFDRNGRAAIFFGRLVPGIRTLISLPAGLIRMNMWTFLLLTTVGSAIWIAFLTISGLVLDSQYDLVGEYLDPISTALIVGFIGWYLYRVITFKQE